VVSFGAEFGDCGGEALLSLGGQAEVANAGVGAGELALDQAEVLGAADELGDGTLAEQECRAKTGDGRWTIAFVLDLDRE
jgi:hypothetical protein